MCFPVILSSEGNTVSDAGIFSPPSIAPFRTANNFDPLIGVCRPRSKIASVILCSLAFFASNAPAKYAAGMSGLSKAAVAGAAAIAGKSLLDFSLSSRA